MVEFKDVTPNDGTPQTYVADIGLVRMTVTRHSMGYEPDRWIAIPSLIVTPKLLQSKDIDEAKAEALDLLRSMQHSCFANITAKTCG